MNKKHLIIAAVVAVAAFLGWKWWKKRQAAAAGKPAVELTPGANAQAAGAK